MWTPASIQGIGELVRLHLRLAVGEGAVALDGELTLRALAGVIVEEIVQPHRGSPSW